MARAPKFKNLLGKRIPPARINMIVHPEVAQQFRDHCKAGGWVLSDWLVAAAREAMRKEQECSKRS